MDLKLPYLSAKDKKAAYSKISSFLKVEGLKNLPIAPTFDYDDSKLQITAKGAGFQVLAVFEEDHLALSLQLGLLYKAFKSKLLTLLEHQLKKHL